MRPCAPPLEEATDAPRETLIDRFWVGARRRRCSSSLRGRFLSPASHTNDASGEVVTRVSNARPAPVFRRLWSGHRRPGAAPTSRRTAIGRGSSRAWAPVPARGHWLAMRSGSFGSHPLQHRSDRCTPWGSRRSLPVSASRSLVLRRQEGVQTRRISFSAGAVRPDLRRDPRNRARSPAGEVE